MQDSKSAGTWKNPWDRMVEKYGYEKACEINSLNTKGNKNGTGNKGIPKSEEHKKKIAYSIKNKYNDTSRV